MSLGGILLGLLNIAIWVAILLLIGAVAQWILGALGFAIPANVVKIFLAIVALVALSMIIALLLGVPVVGPLRLTLAPIYGGAPS